MITYGSVCSGIESASVGWEPLGWQAAWFAEVEAFPSAVLAHHWPQVPNLGDMCRLPVLIDAGLIATPEILVGGTPCQAFSVAGLRGGLRDERGQLTIKYVEVANAIDRKRPANEECVVVWENVPGVLSSKDNAFGCFLGALVGNDDELYPAPPPPDGKSSKYWRWCKKDSKHYAKWPVAGCVYGPQRVAAWRVLDAQYFGVAQRRRRVFVVASARDRFDPAEVLFEFEGLRRDTPPSREAGEGATGDAAVCTGNGYWKDADGVATTLRSNDQPKDETVVVHGTQDPIVSEKAHPLGCNGGQENAIAVRTAQTSANGHGISEEVAHTLDGANGQAVAFSGRARGAEPSVGRPERPPHSMIEKVGALDTVKPWNVATNMQVRRLTPQECERLQGFPDDHTLIPWRGKPAADCPDGPRYKAIGNSKAVPVIRWLGGRIDAAL